MVMKICVCDICGKKIEDVYEKKMPTLDINYMNSGRCVDNKKFIHMDLCDDCVVNIHTYILNMKAVCAYNKEESK